MGKVEQLQNVASQLSEEQLDSVIAYATSLTEPSVYDSAPQEVRASIERGLADIEAGRTVSLDEVMRDIDARISGKR